MPVALSETLRSIRLRLLSFLMRRAPFCRLIGVDLRIAAWNTLGCSLDPSIYIGPRVSIYPIRAEVSIGAGSGLTGTTQLAAFGAISIGQSVLINHGVVFQTGSRDTDDPAAGGVIEPIVIGDNVWIATGAVILPGVTIGEGAVVGAYSVVGSDVAPRVVVVGNPARVIRARKDFLNTDVPSEVLRRIHRHFR
jgi:maltose O-acetyltransferase